MSYEAHDPQRLEELFHAVSELDEDRRSEYLAAHCAGDEALRDAVENLLEAGREADAQELLNAPALHVEARNLAADAELPIERLGPYRILSRLGVGGMGIVYLAERDDEQFRKQVAVKVVPLGTVDGEAVRRFRRERQILANLEHPIIARLLDGGVTGDGLPYLVMEYVDGIPIDRYAAGRRLTVAKRLALFRSICNAVAYAHRNLVVHCDLKPGNILVTADGVPKLLDFGIAKLIGDTTDHEATAALLMTPGYASPEQLRGEPATTATDVYSLGLVLYELLTGARPFQTPDALRAQSGADPARPTSVVTPEAAEQRSTTLGRLRRALAGDLTTILQRALAYAPADRYPSVEQFADDLDRHLADRPILARPQTIGYRARKFVVRHRLPAGIAVLALAAIAAGVASTIVQKRVAEHRFQEVRQLAHYVLFELYDGVSNLSGSTRLRAEMAKRSTGYLNALASEAQRDNGLRLELAEGYLRLGDIQGNLMLSNLGDTPSALASYQKGLGLLDRAPHDPTADRLRALFAMHQAQIANATGAAAEAISRMRAAVAGFEKAAAGAPSAEDDFQLGSAYMTLGVVEQQRGGWTSPSNLGGKYLDRAEALLRRAVAADPGRAVYHTALAILLDRRAQLYALMDPAKTIRSGEQAMQVMNSLAEPDRGYPRNRSLAAGIHGDIAWGYGQINQFDAALDHCRQAEEIYLPLIAEDPANNQFRYQLAVVRRNAGIIHGYAKHWSQAAAEFAKGVADYDILLKAGPSKRYRMFQAELRMRMANALVAGGRTGEAETIARMGLDTFREIANSPNADFTDVRQLIGYLLETPVKTLRDPQKALALLDREKAKGGVDPFWFNEALAKAYHENHRYREAANTMRKTLELLPPEKPGEPPSRARQEIAEAVATYARDAKAAGQ
jgi:tetratricopeptide (TPR) repeat protein